MTKESVETTELGKLLLRIGIALLHAGTGTSKVAVLLLRIARNYGYEAHLDLGTRMLSLSLYRRDEDHVLFHGSRTLHNHAGVNFSILSSLSALSWEVHEKSLTIEQASEAFETILQTPAYPRWLVLFCVGLASSAFCFTFEGDAAQMIMVFGATVLAMFLKQELLRKHFNPFLVTFFATCLSAAIVASFHSAGVSVRPVEAFTTCSLFLIPGVPLITSFIDLMDGFILNGIERGVASLIHAFAIAAGLSFILFAFQIS